MNTKRIVTMIGVPVVSAAIVVSGTGIASATAPSPANYSEGAVNIDLKITNNTGAPMTLSWDGLSGSLDHWNTRPQATLGAGASEYVTGYSHDLFAELSMAVNYTTASGDLATFDVQASNGNPADENTMTGTGVVQGNGTPATDLATATTITPAPGGYDYAVATATIGPVTT
jgi:hypothetical protein